MSCPNAETCKLYNVIKHDQSSAELIADYCLDDEEHKKCARYLKIENGENVAPTLMPDGTDLRDKAKP